MYVYPYVPPISQIITRDSRLILDDLPDVWQ